MSAVLQRLQSQGFLADSLPPEAILDEMDGREVKKTITISF